MEFQFSRRAQRIQEGIFSVLDHKKTELLAAGRKVYNFSVGTPDFSPQPHIMKAVAEAQVAGLFEYGWVVGGSQYDLEQKLNLGFGYPAVVAVGERKRERA